MIVREMTLDDYAAVEALEQRVWGEEAATVEMIGSRHNIFPQGSVVAVDEEGNIVGYAAVQRVNCVGAESWDAITDYGSIRQSHRDNGHILYGIGMSGEKFGVAESVIAYFHKRFIESGICYMLMLGSRVPGYKKWYERHAGSIRDYIDRRSSDGYSIDGELKLYQKHGFEIILAIKDYFPCDKSLNYGALIALK
ncbi:hypothetical protein HGP28_16400 [Vibrio sp. SM6]|uniref:N-acetyltransferase domain-containing protein n=1 Tax=Vibrio agarilyticus TaxID=2726741 RepID=A0A7X8YIJ3_9VIBR|nr:hypothetical protein [Vibrio agarilyticus]NLS14452.1 hypothetical protein [Vibrio agarilyticus]